MIFKLSVEQCADSQLVGAFWGIREPTSKLSKKSYRFRPVVLATQAFELVEEDVIAGQVGNRHTGESTKASLLFHLGEIAHSKLTTRLDFILSQMLRPTSSARLAGRSAITSSPTLAGFSCGQDSLRSSRRSGRKGASRSWRASGSARKGKEGSLSFI